ncbi:MAG: hypothetical protein KDI36_13310, partial [Pseudomonadales bacterium]|nr:hypothetical protein [Pseudomonadales bacterium]
MLDSLARQSPQFSEENEDENFVQIILPRLTFFEIYQLDQDEDGIPDSEDDDIDGDDVLNVNDEFPENDEEFRDTDGDGVGDNADELPFDPTAHRDSDSDGIGDNNDSDIDGDLIPNSIEQTLGLDAFNAEDGLADDDDDGFSNAEEINSRSDPFDPDSLPDAPGIIAFYAVNTTGVEGDILEVAVHRMRGATGAVSIDYVLDLAGQVDATDMSEAVGGTLTWEAGEIGIKRIYLPLTEDSLLEGIEKGRLRLTNPVGGALLGQSVTMFTIVDRKLLPQDELAPGLIGIVQHRPHISEGEGAVEIVVDRLGGSEGRVGATLEVVAPMTGFVPQPVHLEWEDGDAEPRRVSIPVVYDPLVRGRLRYDLNLTHLEGGAQFLLGGAGSSFLVTDEDPSPAGGYIRFAFDQPWVSENSGFAEVVLTRDYGAEGNASVILEYQPFSTASENADFVAFSETVEWAPGEIGSKSVRIEILDDDIEDNNEFIFMTITPASSHTVIEPGAGTSILVIQDPEDLDDELDTDGDGEPDLFDNDDDNDGVTDFFDDFPTDPNESQDTDGDGVGDNEDLFPLDATEFQDSDQDGIGDNTDADDDNDLIADTTELLFGLNPLDPGDAEADFDSDGFSNAEEANSGSDINDLGSLPGPGVIEFAIGSTYAVEGQDIIVRVHRMFGAAGSVSVTYETLLSGDLESEDLITQPTGTLTWGPGEIGVKSFVIGT